MVVFLGEECLQLRELDSVRRINYYTRIECTVVEMTDNGDKII